MWRKLLTALLACVICPAISYAVDADDAASKLGLIPLLWPSTDPDAVEQRQRVYEDSQAAGVRIYRIDLRWSIIEPELGVFDFSRYDALIDEVIDAGFEVVGVLCYGNPNYAPEDAPPGDEHYPPSDPSAFARYVYETVSHFKDRIKLWEVWNEPNAGYRFWKPGPDAAAYGELLKAAYVAAKEADADCKVSYGGLFYSDLFNMFNVPGAVRFLEESFAAHPDLGLYFDAFSFHPYPYPFVAPETELPWQENYVNSTRRLRAVLEKLGARDKELWVTEHGWPTNYMTWGVEPIEQARYLVRGTVLLLSEGVDMVFWFTYKDRDEWIWWQEAAFGLLYEDGTYKPAFFAHKTLAEMLDGCKYELNLKELFPAAREYNGFAFSCPDRWVVVGWSSREGECFNWKLETEAGRSARLFDWQGKQTAEFTTQDETVLTVCPDPAYLVFDGSDSPFAEREDAHGDSDEEAEEEQGCGCAL